MTLHSSVDKTAAETELAKAFGEIEAPSATRVNAFAAFARLGLPTRRVEAWHYTDLRSAMRSAASLASAPDAEAIAAARGALALRERIGEVRLVLVDGHYLDELSDSALEDLGVATIAEAALPPRADPSVLLNTAFAPAALSLVVGEGADLPGRIEIAHFTSGGAPKAVYSRLIVRLHAAARATFVETFFGAGPGGQRNAATQLGLDAGARCEWATLVDDTPDLHLESQFVTVGRDAVFNGFALVPGGDFVRRQIFADHREPGARISFSGLSLIDGKRLADTTLEIVHGAPRGASREFFRHIVADEAVGVYQGKVIVEQYAQKTDGGMKSQAILLSPTASMNNKPELEIFADDVVCGHGATVGALDPAQVFYLQARGIPKPEAEAILLEAFGVEAIEKLADPVLVDAVVRRAQSWLSSRSAGR
jgi:Fe-S cluster assembly protein SufD